MKKPETTLDFLVKILRKCPDKSAKLDKIEQDLCAAHAIGLGVDPIDIIIDAFQKGLVSFNQETQKVSLVEPSSK